MLEELFSNDKQRIRITIFKDASLIRRILIYAKRLFFGTKGAYKEFGDYVVAWERLGSKTSKAYFRFDVNDESKCRGVAGVTRHREDITEIYDLPDINSVDLDNLDLTKSSKPRTRVRRYMRLGYLGNDFETLKRLNRKSRHIYGNVLSDRTGEFKGVLVIDSFHDESPFNAAVLANMPYYLKIIAATL